MPSRWTSLWIHLLFVHLPCLNEVSLLLLLHQKVVVVLTPKSREEEKRNEMQMLFFLLFFFQLRVRKESIASSLVLFSSPWSMVSWSSLPDLAASSSSSHELLESLKHLPVKNLTSTSLLRQFSFWSIPLLSCLVSSFPSLKDELVCEILLAFCGGWSSFFLRPSLPYTENSLFLHIRLLISFMIMRGEKMRMERECQSDKDHHLLPSVSFSLLQSP